MPMIGTMKVQNGTWYILGGALLFVCVIGLVGVYIEPWVGTFSTHPLRVSVWALIVCLTILLPPALLWICNHRQGS